MPGAYRVMGVGDTSYPYPGLEESLVSLQAASIIHTARGRARWS